MEIIDKSHKSDYVLEYYLVFAISLVTFGKIRKVERWKKKLRSKKEENSIRNV